MAERTICIEPWMANEIWHVLVEECEARSIAWHDHHYSFINYLDGEARWGHEYRFMGALGFGGKFYNDGYRWCVRCYSDDDTPKRTEMMRRANERLAELYALYTDTGDG